MRTTSRAPGRLSAPGSGQETVVISGAFALQAPRAGSSTSTHSIAASSHQVRRVAGGLHFLEKKKASLLLTCFPRPAGFLRQKELCQPTETCWTPYVIRWNIRDDAIRSPGTCIFWRKYTGFFSIFHIPDFSPFSPEFSPFFMEKNPI